MSYNHIIAVLILLFITIISLVSHIYYVCSNSKKTAIISTTANIVLMMLTVTFVTWDYIGLIKILLIQNVFIFGVMLAITKPKNKVPAITLFIFISIANSCVMRIVYNTGTNFKNYQKNIRNIQAETYKV